jgi:hypothetical protein
MKTLIAILTSGKLEKLQRCIDSALLQVEHSDVVVIINTLDKQYETLASSLASVNSVKSVITESNGRPGKGKNALIKYFLSTDFTHVIPVDGDDILLPQAVSKLNKLLDSEHVDVLGLINGLALLNDMQLPIEEGLKSADYRNRVLEYMDPKHLRKFNLHVARIRRVSNEHGNFFNRFVILSRTAASSVAYDEHLAGAEDIKQGLAFKLLHHSGALKYMLLSSEDIYLYDVNDESILFRLVCKADPNDEIQQFWSGMSDDQINTLKSFQLECIDDRNGFQC